uniref:Uncharacterized protein n=1 Tax=Cacopsylla melanoneura TaxID=428564 RepID=A0A8D9E3I3_9HEMI
MSSSVFCDCSNKDWTDIWENLEVSGDSVLMTAKGSSSPIACKEFWDKFIRESSSCWFSDVFRRRLLWSSESPRLLSLRAFSPVLVFLSLRCSSGPIFLLGWTVVLNRYSDFGTGGTSLDVGWSPWRTSSNPPDSGCSLFKAAYASSIFSSSLESSF